MTCLLIDSMDELYKVQKDKSKKAELEDLSRAFGLLLHSTGVKAQLILNEAVPYICEEVSEVYVFYIMCMWNYIFIPEVWLSWVVM